MRNRNQNVENATSHDRLVEKHTIIPSSSSNMSVKRLLKKLAMNDVANSGIL